MFAALDIGTGEVVGQLKRRNRSAEFLQFLNATNATVPPDLDIQVILDNYGTYSSVALLEDSIS